MIKESSSFKFDKVFETFELLKSKLSTIKVKLSTAPILAIYNPKDDTELHCDASSIGFGAVLMQRKADHKFHPVFYFSKRSIETEAK